MANFNGSSSTDTFVGTNASDTFAGFGSNDVFVFEGRGAAQTDVVLDFGAIYFTATITGSQEVPPVATNASGSFSGQLLRNQGEFNFVAGITGLDLGGQTAATADNVTAAHFHRAPPGVSGGVVYGFIGAPNNETQGETVVNAPGGTVTGSWDTAEGNNTTLAAMLAPLLAGELYINFHTAPNPAGEIRGQVRAIDNGGDRIDVRSLGVGEFSTLQQAMSESGGSTTISVLWNGQANNLVLAGVPMARLTAADFIFADTSGGQRIGTAGADHLFGGAGADHLIGGSGADRIFAGSGADLVEGGDDADIILGLDGTDTVSGGAGNDDVNGNTGEDQVFGDDGADTVRGGQGNDTVVGGGGNDLHVNGNIGNDVVMGGAGDDSVYGGQNNDTVYGDAGADVLSGDLGGDILYGGAGADRFVLRAGSSTDWVADFNFAEGDRIQLAAGSTYATAQHQGQALVVLSTGDIIGLVGVASTGFNASWVVFV
jgi:Ca2+-binding RTX toxin-like protein